MSTELSSITKPEIRWTIATIRNPKTGEPIFFPRAVDKDTYDTARALRYAMENDYVRGGKFHANLGVVNGYMEACRALMMNGADVKMTSWLRFHSEFSGKLDPITRQLTAANKLNTRVQVLADLKIPLENFSCKQVTDNTAQPRIQHLQALGWKSDREIFASAKIYVGGTNLTYADGDKVTAEWTEEHDDGERIVRSVELVPESSGYSMMVLPSAFLDTIPDTTEVTFTFYLKSGRTDGSMIPAICKAKVIEVVNTSKPKIKSVIMEGYESSPDVMKFSLSTPVTIEGENLKLKEGDKLDLELWEDGHSVETGNLLTKVASSTADKIELSYLQIDNQMCPDGQYWNADTRIVLTRDGVREEHKITFHE